MTEFKLHEASALFPILDNDGLKSLAEDIKSHGLLEPITIYEGKVLDGRNRLAACKLAETVEVGGLQGGTTHSDAVCP